MLTKCPDCGKDVSAAAPACPGCGRPMAAPQAPKTAWTQNRNLGCLGAAVLILVMAFAILHWVVR